jgi:hypothetical protein
MNESEMKQQILASLGEPTIKVEIDPGQWCLFFQKTLRWFKAKKGLICCEVIRLIPGQQQYDLPVGANSVVDIHLPVGYGDIQAIFSQGILDTNLIPADIFGIGGSGGFSRYGFTFSNSAYVQVLQYLETTRRVISAEPTWEVMCGKIYVSNGWCGSNANGHAMLVMYKKEEVSIEDIKDHRDIDLIYRYTEALAKMVLGRIRSKYKSYPAAGGMIDTDGPELIEEGKAEIEKLEEEISDSQFPMGLMVG